MIKWVLLVAGITIVSIFVIAIIKFMLKTEKDSKKEVNSEDVVKEYNSYEQAIDIHSASAPIPVTDMSSHNDKKDEQDFINDIMADFDGPVDGFADDVDSEFADFSEFAHKSKGRRRTSVDFDLDGEMADEYIPSSSDFEYLPRRQKPKKQPLNKALNDLPTELKVLMLSDIFDRKFFD